MAFQGYVPFPMRRGPTGGKSEAPTRRKAKREGRGTEHSSPCNARTNRVATLAVHWPRARVAQGREGLHEARVQEAHVAVPRPAAQLHCHGRATRVSEQCCDATV